MGKYTEEEINNIINLKGSDGKQIDIFDLHGLLFIGNVGHVELLKDGKVKKTVGWDLTKTYTRFSEHSLGISIDDFELCETEDEVEDTFTETLEDAVKNNLI